MIKYIIFDKDGTILDTEKLFRRAWIEVGEEWGFEGIAELYPDIMGNSDEFIIEKLYKIYGTDKDCRAFYNARMNRIMEMLEEDVPLKDGCVEILEFAKANNIPLAIATSTNKERAEKNLKKAGLKGMECYHPFHSEEDAIKFVVLAGKYHLHITEGSDFHGK